MKTHGKALRTAAWLLGLLMLLQLPALGESFALPIDLTGGLMPDPALRQGSSIYEDPSIRVETHRIDNVDTPFNAIIYYAAIQIKDGSQIRTAAARDFTSKASVRASDIAKRMHAVLALNGDFYGVRPEAYVLRQGTVYRDTVGKNLDVLLIDEDGDFHVLLAKDNPADADKTSVNGKRVLNAFAFGPALIVKDQVVLDKAASPIMSAPDSRSQRMCLVQTGPKSYMVITCRSVGLTVDEMVTLVQSLTDRVEVAYMLDGGQSAQMVFMNRLVNKKERDARRVTDIVYFASSHPQPVEGSTAFLPNTPVPTDTPMPTDTPTPAPAAASVETDDPEEASVSEEETFPEADEPTDSPAAMAAASENTPPPSADESGNPSLYWLGMGAIALLGIGGICLLMRRRGATVAAGLQMGILAVLLSLLCSRLGYMAQQIHYITGTGSSFRLFSTAPAEFSVIGGCAGAVLGVLLGARLQRAPSIRPMDALHALAPFGALLLGLGRLCAAAMGGEMMGWGAALDETNRIPAFLILSNSWGETYLAVYLLEAAAAFLTAAAGWLILRKRTFARVTFYLCLSQIFLESLRGDSLQWLFVRTEQLLALVIALTILFLHGRRMKTILPLTTGLACTLLLILVEFALDKSDLPVALLYGIMGAGLLLMAAAEIASCRAAAPALPITAPHDPAA